MGRQRTIDDAGFWRSVQISVRSQEDKATLLYLLTSPFSNIVGVYQIVPHVAAAEMGWTSEQLLPVLARLSDASLIDYDEESCSVWVKIWWDHNSARMAVGPSLRAKTYDQIGQIVDSWRQAYIADFVTRLPTKDDLRASIARELFQATRTVSTPCPYAEDRGASNTTSNSISISTTTPLRLQGGESLEFPKVDGPELAELRMRIDLLPPSIRQDVLDEIEGKRRAGRLKGAVALCSHFQKDPAAFVLVDGRAVQRERADRLATARREAEFGAQIDGALLAMSDEELRLYKARLPKRLAEKLTTRREHLRYASAQE